LHSPLWRRCLCDHGVSTAAGYARKALLTRVQHFHRSAEQRANQPLKELWQHRSSWSQGTTSAIPAPSAEVFQARLLDAHKWRLTQLFGDKMTGMPPSAKHLFISCGVIEGLFLMVNVTTTSPYIFERTMTYHLKYSGLIMAWWGGTYWGLAVARYGPMAGGMWIGARLASGLVFFAAGVVSLILADGVGSLGSWPSYWVLCGSYASMPIVDWALHHQRMIPPWLLRWKLVVGGIIGAALLFGVLKGNYLERNATRLIMEAAAED